MVASEPDLGPNGSARAEAQSRATASRRLHPFTFVVLAVGLVITVALVAATSVAHDENEDRLLQQRVHETAQVSAASIGGLQGQLAAAAVAAQVGEGSGAAFRSLMEPLVGPEGRFVSASVWPLGSTTTAPQTVVGLPPLLQTESVAQQRAFLAAAAGASDLQVKSYLDRDDRRLGYAAVSPDHRFVAYAEAALPKDRRARVAADSAFADLDYALYLGKRAEPGELLASSEGTDLEGRRTATDSVPFGSTSVLLVVSPRRELGGELLARLPWVLAGVGLLLTIAAAFVSERLIRRRERAEELSDRLEEVAEENTALFERQRAIAEQLQRSLLPQSLPHWATLDAAGRYEAGTAGTEVGGDWYDVLPLSSSKLAFSVGDVCGRGLAAAALMASLRYSIRAYALEQDDPATVLDKCSAVAKVTPGSPFATVICGILDADTGMLTIANAGHPPLLIVERGEARYLDTPHGPPVGVDPDQTYVATTTTLADDALVLAYTDGLVERRGEALELGFERLASLAVTPLPLRELIAHLVDSLVGTEGEDDVAVLGLHRHPAPAGDPERVPGQLATGHRPLQPEP